MSNAFSTGTSELEAFMSNSSLDTIEDIEKAWAIAGSELRSADDTMKANRTVGGPFERVLLDAMSKAQQGIINVTEKKAGKKPADYVPTHVDRLVGRFLSVDASKVTEGTGSHRNMLNTVQNALMYAKRDETAVDTVKSAIARRDAAKSADSKARVNGSIVIIGNLSKAAKKVEYKRPLNLGEISAAIEKKAPTTKAWLDWVAKFLTDAAERPDMDDSEAWADIVTAINGYVADQKAAIEAEAKAQSFAEGAVAAAKAGAAKVNKNGTVTVKLSPEQLKMLGIDA